MCNSSLFKIGITYQQPTCTCVIHKRPRAIGLTFRHFAFDIVREIMCVRTFKVDLLRVDMTRLRFINDRHIWQNNDVVAWYPWRKKEEYLFSMPQLQLGRVHANKPWYFAIFVWIDIERTAYVLCKDGIIFWMLIFIGYMNTAFCRKSKMLWK